MKIYKATENYVKKIINDNRFQYKEMIRDMSVIHSNYFYIAVDNKEVVGFLYANEIKFTGEIILFALNVRTDKTNQRIGTKLLNRLEKDLVKFKKKSILLFFDRNDYLEDFYLKKGFEIGENLRVALKIIE